MSVLNNSVIEPAAGELCTAHKQVDYITVTETAKEQIKRRIQARAIPSPGLKLSIATKGCMGLAYKFEYADYATNVGNKDEIVPVDDGISLFIDPKSSLFFYGITMDYYDNGIEYGFRLTNPQEKGRCGCGKSFFV